MRTTNRHELCWSHDHELSSCLRRIPSISACPIRCSDDGSEIPILDNSLSSDAMDRMPC